MIRSSEHILKYQTEVKSAWLKQLFLDYKQDLQFYVDLLWSKRLPLQKKPLSSKILPINILKHSQYRQILYKQAYEIVCSNKNKFSKPIIKNVTINIDSRLFDIQKSNNQFDEFIHLKLPYFRNKRKAFFIRLPIKYHKHSLKFKSWNRYNMFKLKENSGRYFVIFVYYKQTPEKKIVGKIIGIDQGYKKLIVTSDGIFLGREFEKLYEDISRKQQGSRNFKDLLVERDKKINEVINSMDLSNVKQIVIEDLKGIKRNTKYKIYKKFNNKLQRWSYSKVVSKLDRFCEENGILLTKVDPAYTSQTCSRCGAIHHESRNGELYKCIVCGYEIDADQNAAVIVLNRGVYNPSTTNNISNVNYVQVFSINGQQCE